MEDVQKKDRYQEFITYVIQRCEKDKGYAAKLRKADNPNTAYQAWDILLNFGIDITKDYDMNAFSLVGATLSKNKITKNGNNNLGGALKSVLDTGISPEESSMAIRLRRVLACSTQEELCAVLRPILNLIFSKTKEQNPLCFAQLLKEVHYFGRDDEQTQRVKLKWASSFYNKTKEDTCTFPS